MMKTIWSLISVAIIFSTGYDICHCDPVSPKILVATLVRNKAHALPYFLSYFENLNYPKEKISLWIQSDNNADNSIDIIGEWINNDGKNYNSTEIILDEASHGFSNEKGPADWTNDRDTHIINLRQQILDYARNISSDYVFILDADVFLTNPNTLNDLIDKGKTVVAPMLKSVGVCSNFWMEITLKNYCEKTEQYEAILKQEKLGCHPVPMIHSAVLIDLRNNESDNLTYKKENVPNYLGPHDDIRTFAASANFHNVSLHICNDKIYGFIIDSLGPEDSLQTDFEKLTDTKLEIIAYHKEILLSDNLKKYVVYPEKDSLGMDHILMINLKRVPERRLRMENSFNELGINVDIFNAIDAKHLNETILIDLGVKMLPHYTNWEANGRSMNMGEYGCFLSHYYIWQKMVKNNTQKLMVFEDDVYFKPNFRRQFNLVMKDLEKLNGDWDLVFLGRRPHNKDQETYVNNSQYLVHAAYSLGTYGYILSQRGAQKLLKPEALKLVAPSDEYIAMLADTHPNSNYTKYFTERNFITLSAEPTLITHIQSIVPKSYPSTISGTTLVG